MKRRWGQLASASGVLFCLAGPAHAQTIDVPRCGTGVHEAEAFGLVGFPQDEIFCPLIADPKYPRSFASLLRGTFPSIEKPSGKGTTIGSVGLGDFFGLVRWGGPRAGEGLQLDVVGAIFAQFDLDSASNDLINADYIIGVPLTFRRRGFSMMARVYHQSSHLGDEFLLRSSPIQRENLSFESLELLASQEIGPLRLYGGGEHLFRRDPDTVKARLLHTGAELRSGRAHLVQLVSGVDLKTTEQHNWAQAVSGRFGVELTRPSPEGHPIRLVMILVELYKGPSPYGQFFQEDISYVGAGINFSL